MADIGEKAPDFTLPDQNREQKTLSAIQGKNVILAFYPGAFTGGCTLEVCSLRDNMAMLNGLDAEVLGISIDAPGAQKAFAEAHELNFTLLSDYRREAVDKYGVAWTDFLGMDGFTAARRSIFVVDKEGVIRYKWMAERDPIPPYEEITSALKAL